MVSIANVNLGMTLSDNSATFCIHNQILVVDDLLLILSCMTSRLTDCSPVIDNRSTATGVVIDIECSLSLTVPG